MRAIRIVASGAEPGTRAVEQAAGEQWDENVEAVEEDELGVLREVGDLRVIGREISLRGDPTDVRPPEAVDYWGVLVVFLVGMLVVVAVRAGPPERAALDRQGGPDGHHELESARGGVGLVREVAVQEAGNREHPEEVQADGGPDGNRASADPDNGEAG